MKGYKSIVRQRTSLVRDISSLGKRRYFNTYTIGQGGSGPGASLATYTFLSATPTFVLNTNNWIYVPVSGLPSATYSSGNLVSIEVDFSENPSSVDINDLLFQLESPATAATCILIDVASGLTGRVLTDTKWVWGNTTAITTGVSPYTGSFSPTGFDTGFDNFIGSNLNGNWALFIQNGTGLNPTITINVTLTFYV